MKIQFQGGVEADLATSDELNRGFGKMFGAIKSSEDGNQFHPTGSFSQGVGATGNYFIDLGGPTSGWIWYLNEVVVIGADDHTAITGATFAVYSGSPPEGASASGTYFNPAPLGGITRPGITGVPGFVTWGRRSYRVRENEHLSVVVYSPTTAITNLVVVATVEAKQQHDILMSGVGAITQ